MNTSRSIKVILDLSFTIIKTLGTNDELDDIKRALEATRETLEDQNTLKQRLSEANEKITKLEQSSGDTTLLDEIRNELKTAKVSQNPNSQLIITLLGNFRVRAEKA